MFFIVSTAVAMLSKYIEWMNVVFLFRIIQKYYTVCHCLAGDIEGALVLQTELCQDALCYASVVLSTINTQSHVITLHRLLVRSLTCSAKPTAP